MAGSIVATSTDIGQGVTKYTVVWTSDASGAVSANPFDVKRGKLLQTKFLPGAAGLQPTDQYDVTLLDADGVDVLQAGGQNLSNANGAYVVPSTHFLALEAGPLVPVVANAGSTKSGTLILFVGP